MGSVDRLLILLWWSVSSLCPSFGVRWSAITFSVSMRSDVSEPSVFLRLSSFGFSLFYLMLAFILHSMGLRTVSSCSILFTILIFLFIVAWYVVFSRICLYGAALTPHYFSFSGKVFLGRPVFPFEGEFLCPQWDRFLRYILYLSSNFE